MKIFRDLWPMIIVSLGVLSVQAEVNDKPNIIIILADDLGYGDVGFLGCKDIPTPNIDRIATEGIRFTSATVTHAFCSPSRAGIMTGRYQQRYGHECNVPFSLTNPNIGLPLSETLLSECLKEKGYHTMMVGKWDLGGAEKFRPLSRGFDEMFGFLDGGHEYFPDRLTVTDPVFHKDGYRTKLLKNTERVDEKEYLTDAFTREACEFIQRNAEQPFFLYLAYNAPHVPLQAPAEYLNRFKTLTGNRRAYAAMVSTMDDGIGRVLNSLDEAGVHDSTLIFFLSDNGGHLDHGASNAPLRDGKGRVYEGGIRVPMAMCWAGKIPAGGRYDEVVSSLDIFATIADVISLECAELDLDGVSLIPYVTELRREPPHNILFWRLGGGSMSAVREGSYKSVRINGNYELYNLTTDPQEKNDLSKEQPEKLQEILKSYQQWNSQLVAPCWDNPKPNNIY